VNYVANLRAGITPYGKDGVMKKSVTRLASENVHVWANTWNRRVEVKLYKNGRLTVSVLDEGCTVVSVELPDNEGSNIGAFTPTVVSAPGFEFKTLPGVK